jgi:Sulfotransferase family
VAKIDGNNRKIKVLYIAGPGRSGSTLLARLLGEVEGWLNVGEAARFLFDADMQARGIPCGCGSPLAECPFWKDIATAIPPDLLEAGTRMARMRRFPQLLAHHDIQHLPAEAQRILASLQEAYREVVRANGCEVIVDSSKNPTDALLLSFAPNIELHVVHLVRNPRSVVASWTKKKGYLKSHPLRKVIVWWWSYNVFSECLRGRARSYQRVLYGDFVQDPGKVLREITAAVAGHELPLGFLRGKQATLHLQHALAGNPDKLGAGEVTIGGVKSANGMPYGRKFLVNLLTFPLQYRYHCLSSEGESKNAGRSGAVPEERRST